MSTFITKPDYYVGKRQAVIDQLTDDNDSILDTAEEDAIDLVKKKLHHYDVEAIFSQTDGDRDKTVLRWCKYIVLYFIYERADDSFIPESVIKNYDDTMESLDKISQGREQIDLPRLEDSESVPSTKFQYGGRTPRSTF
jgi:hypothetical protein